ncbi:MAG: NAD-dependent epimerase/dehydratase family protein [Capnocytophaga sp.]|nr:NAD-dependent epimerase/dehydratase family protein [Capnocytophaga sp.]
MHKNLQPTLLITGGTGLVGSHLLHQLTQSGQRVRATYRTLQSIEKVRQNFGLWNAGASLFERIEWVQADITDIPQLELAFEGIRRVIHAAGLVSFSPDDFDRLIKTNVEGTATIVNLCIAHQIEKLCYISSVAALSHTHNVAANEQSPWNADQDNHDYAISKHGGEMEVWRASQEGIPVVVVNPSVIIGSGYWDSGSGLMFQKVARGLRFCTTGSTGFVSADDVAEACIKLLQSDVENERFVISAANLSYKTVLSSIAAQLDKPAPKFKISYGWLLFFASAERLVSALGLKKRQLTRHTAYALSRKSEYDGSLITQTIEFQYTDIQKTIRKVCNDFMKNSLR